jgi:hypothetical protein
MIVAAMVHLLAIRYTALDCMKHKCFPMDERPLFNTAEMKRFARRVGEIPPHFRVLAVDESLDENFVNFLADRHIVKQSFKSMEDAATYFQDYLFDHYQKIKSSTENW